jgi:hypothetical protein
MIGFYRVDIAAKKGNKTSTMKMRRFGGIRQAGALALQFSRQCDLVC